MAMRGICHRTVEPVFKSMANPWEQGHTVIFTCLGVCTSVQITHSKVSVMVAENPTLVATQKRQQEMRLDSPPHPPSRWKLHGWLHERKGGLGTSWEQAAKQSILTQRDELQRRVDKWGPENSQPSSPYATTMFVNIYLKSLRNRFQNTCTHNALEYL